MNLFLLWLLQHYIIAIFTCGLKDNLAHGVGNPARCRQRTEEWNRKGSDALLLHWTPGGHQNQFTRYRWKKPDAERFSLPCGKLAECWDANTGPRASCPNIQPKKDGPKVRPDFQYLAYFVSYTSFFEQKMHDRFRLLTLKFPLQKRPEAKEILLVPTLSPKSDHRA